jgi:hypothetical protein
MKKLLALSVLAPLAAHAEAFLLLTDQDNIYVQGDIALDAPGTVSWNSSYMDKFYVPYVKLGSCTFNYQTVGVIRPVGPIGFTCTTPGAVHFTLNPATINGAAYCPGDGAEWIHGKLTLKLDGVVFYDGDLRGPIGICYVTPAPSAVKTWTAPVLTFTNPSDTRETVSTLFILSDANYLYSRHTFETVGNVTCSAYLINKGTRFVKRWVESGFQCSAGPLAVGETATVVVR